MCGADCVPPALRQPYQLAGCCRPEPATPITGYFSHNNLIKVHKASCPNLSKAETDRLVSLAWSDILAPDEVAPGEDFADLDQMDFAILQHHDKYGIDYSLVVARALGIAKADAFRRHDKLRAMKLLERVDALMVRYRKKVINHKWIKHRNHTYYRLTRRGSLYLSHHLKADQRSADKDGGPPRR